ncbi:MAG: hypothetical protein CBE38_00480 [Gammaproteobacteria bacterium TMED278]|jgi:hypothetical protein|nr:hypothetical protein [Gammaproteobacteria bacterium]OUX43190.1 MAG: hypothetical protein CBE38_00480 [Gammaproteobacteria bacterium TMED278]
MLSVKKLIFVTNSFILLLFLNKIILYFQGRTNEVMFFLWFLPFFVFYFLSKNLNIKSYQSFCFVLLIYFLFISLKVFGMKPYIFDIFELILIVSFFIHCSFAPRIIRKSLLSNTLDKNSNNTII